MQIFENNLDNYPRDPNSTVTVGTFDGLHYGHRKLINRVLSGSKPSTLVTFYPHPQTVVARPGKKIKLLTTPDEKVEILSDRKSTRLNSSHYS